MHACPMPWHDGIYPPTTSSSMSFLSCLLLLAVFVCLPMMNAANMTNRDTQIKTWAWIASVHSCLCHIPQCFCCRPLHLPLNKNEFGRVSMCQTRIQQQQRRVRQLWWLSSLPVVPLLLLLLLFILAIGTTVTAAAIIEDGSRPQMAANASNNANQQLQIRFDPFCPSNEYRCGAFAEQRGPQTDPAMRLLHRAQNALIRALSQPFPHQKLLSDQALAGEPEEWKRSLIEHRQQWLQFARWWLVFAALLALVPPVFVLLFLCIRCCMCLCRRGKKKEAAAAAASNEDRHLHTDRRWDGVKRVVLNALISVLIVANVFCAAILLLSTQYAQHGLDELPTRLHYCANDLLVYRSDTAEQVRKLLRDDFGRFNSTLQTALDSTGQAIVQRFKRSTGIDHLEEAVTRAGQATSLRARFTQMRPELERCLDSRHSLQTRLLRLRHAREGLAQCERMARTGDSAAACHKARKAINPLLELATNAEEEDNDDNIEAAAMNVGTNWEGEDKPREMATLLPEQVPATLAQLEQIDLERHFAIPFEGLQLLQQSIQNVVDSRRADVDERIRMLDRTLQTHYDQIGQAIKSVDLRFLDEQLLDPMMRQRERFRHFVHIGWLIALVVSGVFAFLALAFLLGLCFGCCGRRPSEYADDDCCVRSTGANFFGCSIWLSLVSITLFGTLSALAMLLGATTAHLMCHPLQDPLSRPDMLSLADRLVTLYGLDRPSNGNGGGGNRLLPNQVFTANRRPADLIRGCAQGRTLYSMFEFDKKFTLLGHGGPTDEYEEMRNAIRQFLLSGRVLDSAINQAIPADGQQNSSPFIQQSSNNNNNFAARWQAFSAEMATALQALGQIQMPEWHLTALKEFCVQKTRFQQLDTVIAELRSLQQSVPQLTQSEMASTTTETNNGIINEDKAVADSAQQQHKVEELDSVLRFLEELRPDTVQVRALLEDGCAKVQHLHTEVLSTLQFDTSALLTDLARAEREFGGGSEDGLRRRLHALAGEFANELAELVRQYGVHINQSMSTEVSSCTPLAEIAHNTGVALCDYALDPLNSLWLALGVGLFLLLPTIVLATVLNPLYRRTHAYTKYTMPSMHTADCYQQNEARFATDIYGIGAGYGANNNSNNKLGAAAAASNGGGSHYQQPSTTTCTQITSPYAMSNYGYQELGPPVYMGTTRRC